jgi:hypothetical protein
MTMPHKQGVRRLDDKPTVRLNQRASGVGRSAQVKLSFASVAAKLRKRTKRRKQTPSEVLLRDGREQR